MTCRVPGESSDDPCDWREHGGDDLWILTDEELSYEEYRQDGSNTSHIYKKWTDDAPTRARTPEPGGGS